MLQYHKAKELKPFLTKLKVVFANELKDSGDGDEEMKTDGAHSKPTNSYAKHFLSSLYIFICTFQHPDNLPPNLRNACAHITQGLQFMHQTFADKANPLDDTWTNCITGCLTIAMCVA